jgi:hypothetical protein
VPNSAASVSWEATFEGPSGLFRQFLDRVLRSSAEMVITLLPRKA